jgi:hypothetical protein
MAIVLLTDAIRFGKNGKTARRPAVFDPYSHVDTALVRTYGVQERDLGRFRARITFLQKGGLLGVSPGKGKALRYTPDLIHRLIFATELAEFGATPAETLGTVADLWDSRIRRIFERAETAAMAPPGRNDIAMMLGGISLTVGAWTSTAKALPNVNGFPLHRLAGSVDLLMRYEDPPPRCVIVNLSARLRRFHSELAAAREQRPILVTESSQLSPSHESSPVQGGRRRARGQKRAGRRRQGRDR